MKNIAFFASGGGDISKLNTGSIYILSKVASIKAITGRGEN